MNLHARLDPILLDRWATLGHTRRALGAHPRCAGEPLDGCAYCYPTLIAADLWDADGRPCCLECHANPARVSVLPTIKGDRL